MTYTVYELRDSESGSVDTQGLESGEVWSLTKRYLIGQCFGGFTEVKDAISQYLPRYVDSYAGYWRRKSMAIKGVGKGVFEVTGEYTTLVPVLPGSAGDGGGGGGNDGGGSPEDSRQLVPGSVAWDTTGATEHITSAISERVISSQVSDDFQHAINVNGTTVQGIDKFVPAMKYSETWIMPSAVGLSNEFISAVYSLTGTVNLSPFRAFDPGEALFMGGRAQWSGDQPYTTVTFDFQCRANNDAYYVKGLQTTTKKGWEYPWVVYEPFASASGILVQKPRALVIDKIYEERDWGGLGIVDSAPGGRRYRGTAENAETQDQVDAFFER
jgi:hypothetical protein